MIFVETSVLIGFLRGARTPAVARLETLESDGVPYAIPAVCAQEVLQGARDEREWRALRRNLSTQRIAVPGDAVAVHWDAARIYFDCRRRGLTVRGSVDCLIAAMTLEAKATLLHDDDDYDRIARVRPLSAVRV